MGMVDWEYDWVMGIQKGDTYGDASFMFSKMKLNGVSENGVYPAHGNLPSSKLTVRPCQIGVERLVSSKNW